MSTEASSETARFRKCNRLRKITTSFVVAVVCSLAPLQVAIAVNNVEVESVEAPPNGSNIKVGVYLTNDVPISAIVLPLELRTVTGGAYVAGPSLMFGMNPENTEVYECPLGLGYGNPDALPFIVQSQHADPSGTSCSGPVSNSYAVSGNVNFISPDAVFFVSVTTDLYPNDRLAPGSDGSGYPSFWLTFSVGPSEGTFVIDTCCKAPANHLVFVDADSEDEVVPTFTPGVVTVRSDDLAYWPDCGCPTAPFDQVINSSYGPRWIYRTVDGQWDTDYHDGIDIRNSYGEPVYASTAGKVTRRVSQTGYGYYLSIKGASLDLAGDLQSHYAHYHHLQEPSLQVGNPVTKGNEIGVTGWPSNPHIHFEVQFDETNQHGSNPLRFLQKSDLACPEFVLAPVLHGIDFVTGVIASSRTEVFDLNRISIWVYPPNQVGQQALIDFENRSQMNEWEAGTTAELRFFENTAYDITVALLPYDLQSGHDLKFFDFYANPVANITDQDWIGVQLWDVNSSYLPPSLLPASAAIQATTCGPLNTYGNITGKSPNTLMDFFGGELIDSSVNLYWRGSQNIAATGVMLYRAVGNEEPVPLTDHMLPFRNQAHIGDTISYIDVMPTGGIFKYRLKVELSSGSVFSSEVVEISIRSEHTPVPLSFALDQNVPNPFNSETVIEFTIDEPTDGRTTVQVFDILGRTVRILFDEANSSPGRHQCVWDGKDNDGAEAGSGVYLYRIASPGHVVTRKMVLLK